jgi:hypothetical protein
MLPSLSAYLLDVKLETNTCKQGLQGLIFPEKSIFRRMQYPVRLFAYLLKHYASNPSFENAQMLGFVNIDANAVLCKLRAGDRLFPTLGK